MRILDGEYPPNFEEIKKVFPIVEGAVGVLYAWGDRIYNPSSIPVPEQLIAHEHVHSERQLLKGVEEWWVDYLCDPAFRLEEELLAHIREYKYFSMFYPRNKRRLYLKAVAERLSGPLYGRLVKFEEAKLLIKGKKTLD